MSITFENVKKYLAKINDEDDDDYGDDEVAFSMTSMMMTRMMMLKIIIIMNHNHCDQHLRHRHHHHNHHHHHHHHFHRYRQHRRIIPQLVCEVVRFFNLYFTPIGVIIRVQSISFPEGKQGFGSLGVGSTNSKASSVALDRCQCWG